MYASYIKSALILLLFSTIALAQEKEDKAKDTLVYKQKYGLRVGADLSKLARTFLDDNYTGFELMGDYRLTKKMYLAGEIGNEERTLNNEVLSNTTKGSYFKAGIDINLFKNWLEMENLIYVGFRVGASTFSQTRNNYNLYNVNNQYWDEQIIINESEEFSGLAALWGEVQIGFKAEVFTNLFAGLNVQLKFLGSETELDGYENLYIPGFNRTYDSSRFGAGFGFNIAYLVPIFKKDKIVVQEKQEE
ncbi:DUF6048 family protein [uncultured Winogradskyella sp.]|uniref:DUF6048 family protein n=1 Tax=uncultured Winogradskyella sp. TaxID=395353 RepID=UPI0030DADCDD|tara:strand:- start:73465 stop:74205 length:741 start_codon:yes stop_codon:yes gene_type:complete